MDVASILERQRISVMTEVMDQLIKISEEWVAANDSTIPEADWSKIRDLDFQENIQTRNKLDGLLENKSCLTCPAFEKHVGGWFQFSFTPS